jgi:hypothetical protein
MGSEEFISRLRVLHDKAKRGTLTAAERPEYEQSRRELGRLLLVAQQMSRSGQTLRNQFRVAQLIKIEVDMGGSAPEKTSTIDLAGGGFAVLLPAMMRVGRVARFTLHLPAMNGSGKVPISGTAKVASCRAQGNLHRVSFSFDTLEPNDREQLEMVIVDSVLARFVTPA